MFNPAKTAETIVKTLRRHGAGVVVSYSGLSKSRYLTVSTVTDTMRVRVSDHVAKPTYELINGSADYEVGNHDMAATESAAVASVAIMDRLSISYNERAMKAPEKAAATRKANQEAKFDDKMARRDAAVAKWIATNAPEFDTMKPRQQHEYKMLALKATMGEWK